MKQLVDKPTRGEYLLDLAITDIDDCNVSVLPKIADHNAILAKMKVRIPTCKKIVREVWHFRGAAWHNLKCELRACSWQRLEHGTVDEAVEYFLELLKSLCNKYIPTGKITENKGSHPWLTDACERVL